MKKFVYTKNGLVVAVCLLVDLSGNSYCVTPEGTERHEVLPDSPVIDGWRYLWDEGNDKFIFLPPLQSRKK